MYKCESSNSLLSNIVLPKPPGETSCLKPVGSPQYRITDYFDISMLPKHLRCKRGLTNILILLQHLRVNKTLSLGWSASLNTDRNHNWTSLGTCWHVHTIIECWENTRKWFKANIAFIFRKWNINIADNYKPVSLTCICDTFNWNMGVYENVKIHWFKPEIHFIHKHFFSIWKCHICIKVMKHILLIFGQ